jgi:hypothetical protein
MFTLSTVLVQPFGNQNENFMYEFSVFFGANGDKKKNYFEKKSNKLTDISGLNCVDKPGDSCHTWCRRTLWLNRCARLYPPKPGGHRSCSDYCTALSSIDRMGSSLLAVLHLSDGAGIPRVPPPGLRASPLTDRPLTGRPLTGRRLTGRPTGLLDPPGLLFPTGLPS